MSEKRKEEKPTYNEKNENECHNDHKKTKPKTKTIVPQFWFLGIRDGTRSWYHYMMEIYFRNDKL